MGTIGGSVAHADPAADYPAALVALEAQIRLVSANSDRTCEAGDFFLDAFTTALEPGEIVVEVQVAAEEPSEGYRYEKVAHPASGFAVVGVAARISKSGGQITMARIGVTGMGSHAFRARNAEKLLESGAECRGRQRRGGRGRGRQFGPLRLGRLPPATWRGSTPRARWPRHALEGVVKISADPIASPHPAGARLCAPAGSRRFWPGACRAARASTGSADDEYAMRMKMVLASISGQFDGKVKISERQSAAQFPAAGGRLGQDRLHEGRRPADALARRRPAPTCSSTATCRWAAPSPPSASA